MDTNNVSCGSYGSSLDSLEEVSPLFQFYNQYEKHWARTCNHINAHTNYQFSSHWVDFFQWSSFFFFLSNTIFLFCCLPFLFLFFTNLIFFILIFLLLFYLLFLLVVSASIYYSDFPHLPFPVALCFLFLLALFSFSISAYYFDSLLLSFSATIFVFFSRFSCFFLLY